MTYYRISLKRHQGNTIKLKLRENVRSFLFPEENFTFEVIGSTAWNPMAVSFSRSREIAQMARDGSRVLRAKRDTRSSHLRLTRPKKTLARSCKYETLFFWKLAAEWGRTTAWRMRRKVSFTHEMMKRVRKIRSWRLMISKLCRWYVTDDIHFWLRLWNKLDSSCNVIVEYTRRYANVDSIICTAALNVVKIKFLWITYNYRKS